MNFLKKYENLKVELITDLICKNFNKSFKQNETGYYIYEKYIKNNNGTTSKEFF